MRVPSEKMNYSSMLQGQKPQAAIGMRLPEVSENKTSICITRSCANILQCKSSRPYQNRSTSAGIIHALIMDIKCAEQTNNCEAGRK
jgi:hypothetical protein